MNTSFTSSSSSTVIINRKVMKSEKKTIDYSDINNKKCGKITKESGTGDNSEYFERELNAKELDEINKVNNKSNNKNLLINNINPFVTYSNGEINKMLK